MQRSIAIVADNVYPVLDGSSLRVGKVVQAIRGLASDWSLRLIAAVRAEHAAGFLEWCDQNGLEGITHRYNGDLFEPRARTCFVNWVRSQVQQVSDHVQGFIVFGGIAIAACSEVVGESVSIADVCDEKSPHAMREIALLLRSLQVRMAIRRTWWLYLYLRSIRISLRPYRAVTVAAHDDAERLYRLTRHPRILIVPNGVDIVPSCRGPLTELGNKSVVFHGVLDYPPNRDAVLFMLTKICPLVHRLDPEVKFYVVGRNPDADLYRYAWLTKNAEIIGPVENIWSWLCSAKLGVYPIRLRTGIQNKLLEAWAAGLPVVASAEVISALHHLHNDEVPAVVARSAGEFAQSIVSTLNDESRRVSLGACGKDFVTRYFLWEQSAQSFLRTLGILPNDN